MRCKVILALALRLVLPNYELGSLSSAGDPYRDQQIPKQFTIEMSTVNTPNLRLNIILVSLALGRDLDSVPLGDDADVALEVALDPATCVVRVSEKRPLVVKLVI